MGFAPHEQLSPHFQAHELACPCGRCSGYPEDLDEIRETAAWLEKVRLAEGGLPLIIISGYRCPAHNKAVGGAPDSQHLLGRAADVTVRDLSPATLQKICRAHWPTLVRGLGSGRGKTHIDRRDGTPALWRYT